MSKQIPRAKIIVVLETYPNDEIVLRQEKCVFDNHSKQYLCKRPQEINVAELWEGVKDQAMVGGAILGQYQKECSEKSKRKALRKIEANR